MSRLMILCGLFTLALSSSVSFAGLVQDSAIYRESGACATNNLKFKAIRVFNQTKLSDGRMVTFTIYLLPDSLAKVLATFDGNPSTIELRSTTWNIRSETDSDFDLTVEGFGSVQAIALSEVEMFVTFRNTLFPFDIGKYTWPSSLGIVQFDREGQTVEQRCY